MGAALSVVVIFVAVLSIPLRAAAERGLSPEQATGWILGVYGIAGGLTLAVVARYRQPLLLTGNIFILIFVASVGAVLSWPELVGASMVAGVLVLVLGAFGLTDRLAAWLPPPIVFGLLAGAVLPFVVDLFTALGRETVIVGTTLGVYLLARATVEPRVPAILPALVAGVLVAVVTGSLGPAPADITVPLPAITLPTFSLAGLLTATPVLVVLVTLQAHVPSIVFLRDQGYRPPEHAIAVVSGTGSTVGSLLGPLGVSLSLPATALSAGPVAGAPAVRHWSAAIAGAASVVIALLAGLAVELAEVLPAALLQGVVGLAVLGVLPAALRSITTGPLRVGPLFAFAIALSDLSLLGLGPFFWALVGGLAVSLLLERQRWSELRAGYTDRAEDPDHR